MKHISEYPHLRANWIKDQKRARAEGITQTCRVHNYQMKVLITLAVQELYRGGYNEEVRTLVLSMHDIAKKGYFDNDHS